MYFNLPIFLKINVHSSVRTGVEGPNLFAIQKILLAAMTFGGRYAINKLSSFCLQRNREMVSFVIFCSPLPSENKGGHYLSAQRQIQRTCWMFLLQLDETLKLVGFLNLACFLCNGV